MGHQSGGELPLVTSARGLNVSERTGASPPIGLEYFGLDGRRQQASGAKKSDRPRMPMGYEGFRR